MQFEFEGKRDKTYIYEFYGPQQFWREGSLWTAITEAAGTGGDLDVAVWMAVSRRRRLSALRLRLDFLPLDLLPLVWFRLRRE